MAAIEGESLSRKSSLLLYEFFCGIGGLHYSMIEAAKLNNLNVPIHVRAYDINPHAAKTWLHNFGKDGHRVSQAGIHALSLSELENADIWLLSPPCQPYTRAGLQKDDEDPRAQALLHIIECVPKLRNPPMYMLLENVKNFETSRSRQKWVDSLAQAGFDVQEFLLSPIQIGIPNERLRYFCLAKRKPLRFSREFNGELQTQPPQQGVVELRPISSYLRWNDECEDAEERDVLLSDETLAKFAGIILDIVTPQTRCTSCFTKAYRKFLRGTGSLLATSTTLPEGITIREDNKIINTCDIPLEDLKKLQLRFFSPREVACLHGFPDSFSFPPDIVQAQRYALLGNSLNVSLVARLLSYLITEPVEE